MFCCSRITLDEDRVVEGDDLYMPELLTRICQMHDRRRTDTRGNDGQQATSPDNQAPQFLA
jgi:hypothetical protein